MLDLCELPYIKRRNQLRLNEAGIYSTLEFYHAPEHVLTKQVFKSINGTIGISSCAATRPKWSLP